MKLNAHSYPLDPRLRRNCIAMLLGVGLLILSCAIAMVWMQQEISRTAGHAAKLEARLAEKVDKLRYLDEKISAYISQLFCREKFPRHCDRRRICKLSGLPSATVSTDVSTQRRSIQPLQASL